MRLFLATIFCVTTLALVNGQATLDLISAEFNESTASLELRIRALDRHGNPIDVIRPKDIDIEERVNEGPPHPISIITNRKEVMYDTINLTEDTVQVLFLLDNSRAISNAQFDRAKESIEEFFEEFLLGSGASYYLMPFADDFAERPREINVDNYSTELARLEPSSAPPDLYRAIIHGLRALELEAGKKIVFLISAASDQSEVLPRYESGAKMAPLRADVLSIVREFDDDLYLFPINPGSGLSDTTKLFEELVQASRQKEDLATTNGQLPTELDRILESRRVLRATHRLEVETPNGTFIGLPRQLFLSWKNREGATSILSYVEGTYTKPKTQGNRQSSTSYLLGAGVGTGIVLFLLFLFAYVYPRIRQIGFRRRHLVPYQAVAGRQVMDPFTREPIQAGELVVSVCRQVIPWQTWKECGHTCPRFPGCTTNNLQCKGAGGIANSGFHSLQGPHRRLNWIWFGALGGFLAWVLAAMVFIQAGALVNAFSSWTAAAFPSLANASGLIDETLLGASFGFGISLMLSIIEERTESRRFSFVRILLRTFLGTLLALLVFGLSFFFFQQGSLRSALVAGGIAWLFFGLSLGLVLSFFGSSISIGRGLLGGLLAGLVGFAIYTLLGTLSEDFLLAKVVGLVTGGAVLGGVLDTVVQLSESFEMEFLQPANYRRNVPLSKWLSTGSEIIIGTQPGSQVYVKWPDEAVSPEHAKIKLEGERVYLIPLAETLVNGSIVNQKRIQLQDKDLIQLGRNAITQMRFLQKQEE